LLCKLTTIIMLSRLCRPAQVLGRSGVISFDSHVLGMPGLVVIRPLTSGTKPLMAFKEGPERDLVNFPRPKRLLDPLPTRLGFIPDSWFQFFYSKTGVTGPYVFGVGFTTYILSKEILVLEHEFWTGVSLFMMIIFAVKKFGPQIRTYLSSEREKLMAEWNEGRDSEIKAMKETIENEKKAQWQAEGQKMLFDVKRENVGLQLEAAYRERLRDVYAEVKKRLDYQVDKQQVETNIQQKHMVNWIISRVQKAITPEAEQENLRKCISDLKGLAAKA